MAQKYPGMIVSRTIEVRFAFSGRLASVRKHVGDSVKQGELLASLDRKFLQAELDRQLADYEIQRAEFETANKTTPSQKVIQQARLNAAVKEVELSKAKLDQVDLFSPVSGTVIDDGGNVLGLNVTPSSNQFTITEVSDLAFRFEIRSQDVFRFAASQELIITIGKQDLKATTGTVLPIKSKFYIQAAIPEASGILPGMAGVARIAGI